MITNLLAVMILGTTLVLFISLPISLTKESTSVENICGPLEHRKEKSVK